MPRSARRARLEARSTPLALPPPLGRRWSVLQQHAGRFELPTDAVGGSEVARLAGGAASGDPLFDPGGIAVPAQPGARLLLQQPQQLATGEQCSPGPALV